MNLQQNKYLPFLLLGLSWSASAQSPSLQVTAQVGAVSTPVTAGGTFNIQATSVGRDALATVTARNAGSTPLSITQLSLSGSADLSFVSPPTLPVTLQPNGTVSFTARYAPSSSNRSIAQANISYSTTTASEAFPFTVTGTVPDLGLSYFIVPDGPVTPVASGGKITFPSTPVQTSRLATIVLTNRGSVASTLTTAAVTAGDFQLQTPLTLPATIQPGTDLRFTVAFFPRTRGTLLGTLNLVADERISLIALEGLGTVADLSLSYVLPSDGNVRPLVNGGQLLFPQAAVNVATPATIIIANQGNGPSTITNVAVSGAGFQLSNLPSLPVTVEAGRDVRFNVIFTAPQTGSFTGALRIDSPGQTVTTNLLGSTSSGDLTVAYALQTDGNVRPLPNGGVLSFLPTGVNSTSQATVVIFNQGTAPGRVNAVSLSGVGFQLNALPLLPATIDPGKDLRFNINFTPTLPGTFTATLRIDLADRAIIATVQGSTATGDLSVVYALQTDGNARPLANGGVLSFSPTSLNTTAQATVVVFNQGTTSGRVNSVSLTGSGFQLNGLPILPANVDVGKDLRFNIVFTPRQPGEHTGTLRIDFQDRSLVVTLQGSTAAADIGFTYVLEADNNFYTVISGGTINFAPTAVDTVSQAALVITNNGSGAGILNGITVLGSTFQVSGLPPFPFTLEPGRSVRVLILFSPRQIGSHTGTVRVDYDNRSFVASLSGSTSPPEFIVSYVDPQTNNNTVLSDSGTVRIPSTLVNATTTTTVVIANRGAGTGFLNNVTINGTGFQLIQLPPLPSAITSNRDLQFGIRFTPTQQQRVTGTLQIELSNKTLNLTLDGLGVGSTYLYERSEPVGPIVPDGTISFGETPLGQSATVALSFKNAGSSEGQITSIGVTGNGFQLVDAPILPITLKVNDVHQLTLRFNATQPGASAGRLRIGNDNFVLLGTAVGSRLLYSFVNGDSTPIDETNGIVVFSPTRVGEKSSVEFVAENTGNRPIVISSINLASPSSIFSMPALPALPMNLGANETLRFNIQFTPNNTGTLTSILRINNTSISLSGSGLQPLPLPDIRFQGTSGGTQEPLQQPAIGLSLTGPYPLPLRGRLNLNFVSDVFSANPAIQFSSGGRVANFTIPANSTQAIFDGGLQTVRLQTGTVAGNIVVTPTFATQADLDLTPASAPSLTFTIAKAPPRLLDASISSRTNTALSVTVSGFSTTRVLKTFDVQLNPRPGSNLSTSRITINVEASAILWFQSAAAEPFGGLFTITVPLSFQGGAQNEDLVGKIQSLGVTVSNDLGASNNLNLGIQ